MSDRPFKTLTVVYTIEDSDRFNKEEWPHIHALFTPGPHDGKPFRIHATSADDELRRCGLVEEALDRLGETSEAAEAIREILSCPELSSWDWKDFK